MKLKIPVLALSMLFGILPVVAQIDREVQPADAFEIKVARVVNGHAISFGMAGKLYSGPRFALTPEIMLLGGPVVGITLRYDFPLNENVRFTPHLGVGFPAFPISAIGILGFDVSYAVDSNTRLFIDVRRYGFGNGAISGYGSGIYELTDLQFKNPIVLSAGVSF